MIATGAVVLLALVAFVPRGPGPMPPPSASHSAVGSAAPSLTPTPAAPTADPTGPTVLYSILGQGRLTLYERRLDGRSEPQELASRPADNEGVAHFIVGPDRGPVLFARRTSRVWMIEPVALAAPEGVPRWTAEVQWTDFQNGVWSPDGRYWAGFGDDDNDGSYVVVVDAEAGKAWHVSLEYGQYLQGFDGPGPRLVVRDDQDAFDDPTGGVAFETIDPSTGERHSVDLDGLDAPPHSSYGVDIAPRSGLFVTEDGRQNGELIIGDLRTGAQEIVYRAERTFHWMAFFPGGDRVAATHSLADDLCGETQQRLIVAGLDGTTRELWHGTAGPLDFVFSPEGDIVGFDGWGPSGSVMVVADSNSGRSVELPMPDGAYLGELMAIRGGQPLPEQPVAPAPSVPQPTVGPDPDLVAGAPWIVTGASGFDFDGCTATVHVRLLAPAVDGSLVVVDELPPIELRGIDQREAWVDVAPRPGSSQVAVRYGDDRTSTLLLWTPRDPGSGAEPAVEPLPVPADWPIRRGGPVVWRPDGQALGLKYSGGSRSFIWFELGDTTVRRTRSSSLWQDVVGWTPDSSAIVVERYGCIDFCDVRQWWLAVVRLRDGRTIDVTLDAPVDALGSGTDSVSVRTGLQVSLDVRTGRIRFSAGIDVPGSFTARWPASAGLLDYDRRIGLWSRYGRTLFVAADTDRGRELFRVANPRAGEPLRPVSVGLLPERSELEAVDLASGWVQIEQRELGSCSEGLVDVASGLTYLTDCFGDSGWYILPR